MSVHPGPPARGQPRSRWYAIRMPLVLARDVRASGANVVPGQRLNEVATGPLEYRPPNLVDPASRLGFRVPDKRDQPALRSHARDDVHVVREDRHLVDVHLTSCSDFTNGRAHEVGVSSPNGALP